MTTFTDDGQEWVSDKIHDDVTDRIDTIAVGTGTGSESGDASQLADEVYRSDDSNNNVEFLDDGDTGEREATIVVNGGTEVPPNSQISEIAIIAGGADGGGTVVFIDEFADVTVEAGHEEAFTIPYDFER